MLHIFLDINAEHQAFVITLLNEPLSGSLVVLFTTKTFLKLYSNLFYDQQLILWGLEYSLLAHTLGSQPFLI